MSNNGRRQILFTTTLVCFLFTPDLFSDDWSVSRNDASCQMHCTFSGKDNCRDREQRGRRTLN